MLFNGASKLAFIPHGDGAMRVILQRFGIIAFAVLSLVMWGETALVSGKQGLMLLSTSRTMLLGASLACLTALLLSELLRWGTSFLEDTRREMMVAELATETSWDSTDSDEHHIDSTSHANRLEMEESYERREWTDVRQNEKPEALRI
jgi:hypothetical protein